MMRNGKETDCSNLNTLSTSMVPLSLVNGSSEVLLSTRDRGLSYGDGVFRTMQAENGRVLHWALHFHRLVEDCKQIGIQCPSEAYFIDDFQKLLPTHGQVVAKIIVTRGESTRGYLPAADAEPNRIVSVSPMPCYPQEYIEDGVKLHLCKLRLSHQPLLAGIKHLNRLENVLARMEWNDVSIADGLLLDHSDHVIECVSSNLFIRRGNRLSTPDLSLCGVAGVTRQRIINLCPELSLDLKIEPVRLDTLIEADEVMICNSLYGVWQVRALMSRTWPKGACTPMLRKALNSCVS